MCVERPVLQDGAYLVDWVGDDRVWMWVMIRLGNDDDDDVEVGDDDVDGDDGEDHVETGDGDGRSAYLVVEVVEDRARKPTKSGLNSNETLLPNTPRDI